MYYLDRFGSVDLPLFEVAQDAGTSATLAGFTDMVGGGMYDPWGTYQAPPDVPTISAYGEFLADTTDELADLERALRGQRGRRAKLWRRWPGEAGDTVEWTWARFIRLQARRTSHNTLFQGVTALFQQLSATWYGTLHAGPWTLDSGYELDSGLALDETTNVTTLTSSPFYPLARTNSGNATVDTCVWTITAGSAPITALTIQRATNDAGSTFDAHVVYSDTIAVGQSLVIDCGARSVKNNGADDYASFSFGAEHRIDGWLPLNGILDSVIAGTGLTNFKITFTGGGATSTVTTVFSDGHE